MDSRKRGRPETNGAAGAGFKRPKEADSGLGSKTKPCTKFFSTSGCPFGEACHFQHFVPGGFNAVAHKTNLGNLAPAPPRNSMMSAPQPGGPPAATTKTRMCNKFNTAEGCRFGDKCHFAHGERELGKPNVPAYDDGPVGFPGGRLGGRFEQPPPAAASFGASATAKISVDGSLAGAIIGKGGINTKHIHHVTGAKLYIKDHESDANQKNIELEGTFDQIKLASAMVKDLIMSISSSAPHSQKFVSVAAPGGPGSNFKTKLCENFTKGSCTFGERCHFAHGESELRKSAAA